MSAPSNASLQIMKNLEDMIPLKETSKALAIYPEKMKIYEVLEKKFKITVLKPTTMREHKQIAKHQQENST